MSTMTINGRVAALPDDLDAMLIDVVRGDLVSEVHQAGIGTDGEDHALHDTDERVADPEVRGQRDETARHGGRAASGPGPPRSPR